MVYHVRAFHGGFMEDLQHRYARLILETMVRIQEGDALSINTEDITLPFAKLLAAMASEITMQPVNIVVMKHGQPQGVIPVEPIEHDVLRPQPTGAAMLRIVDTENRKWKEPEDLAAACADLVQLQRYEHLAEPLIFDRRIAVPWAVVHVPGPNWTKHLLGEDNHEDALWNLLQDIWKLDEEQADKAWDNQIQLLHYRKRLLESLHIERLLFRTQGTELSVGVAANAHWEGGLQTLPSGRSFISSLPLEELFIAADRTTAKGVLTATRPMNLFGEQVLGATFTVQNGEVIAWNAEHGKHLLDAYFKIDAGARHVGELALADENTAISRAIDRYGVSLLDRHRTTRIRFGAANPACLDAGAEIDNEEQLQSRTTFNISNVVCDCPIGDGGLVVTAVTSKGDEIVLMEHGVFID